MKILSGQLQLKYAFISSPNPIRASATGAVPNTVDLTVIISNPRPRPVELAGIIIEIPMGENAQRTLSSDPSLPEPIAPPSSDWTIGTDGGTLTIEANEGSAGELASMLVVRLEGIIVNEMAGVVPITVREIYPSGASTTDNMSYWLTKLEADFPVTDFWAEPAELDDFSRPVKLFWRVSDQGKTLAYGLQSNDWQPRDCIGQGNCFSWQDGEAGVPTPPLNAGTTFALSVVETEHSGGRRELKKLSLTVRIVVPSVLENSYVERIAMDRLVSMHWIAYNSVRCEVLLNGEVVDEHAPTDTYVQGYPLILPETAGTYQLSVKAYSDSGARAEHIFTDVAVHPPAAVTVGGQVRALAFTPDSGLALVANLVGTSSAAVTMIDVRKWQTDHPTSIPIPAAPQGIAVTPDGTYALSTSMSLFGTPGDRPADPAVALHLASARMLPDDPSAAASASALPSRTPLDATDAQSILAAASVEGALATTGNLINFIDIRERKVESGSIPVPGPCGVAITPDGRYAFAAELFRSDVVMIDIPNRSLAASINTGNFVLSVTITPDGRLALVLPLGGGDVTMIDVATRTVEPARIPTVSRPSSIAITPDGRLALVGGEDDDLLTVIDIPGRRVDSTIPVPRLDAFARQAIDVTDDGRYAIVASPGVLTIIDIPARRPLPGTISIPNASGVRIAPDGTAVMVFTAEGNQVLKL